MPKKLGTASILADQYFNDLTLASLVKGNVSEEDKQQKVEYQETKRLNSLLPHQRTFLDDKTTRHLGLVAGFGAGKSFSLSVKMLQLAYDNPGYTGIAMEPTFGLISDILIPQTCDLWDDWGVDYKLYRGAAEFEVRCPNGKVSRILLRSFENYQRIRGINAAWSVVDEIDTVKPSIATQAFRLLQGRIRTGLKPQIAVCSTPEGFGFLYDFFVTTDDDSKRLIRAKTTDNPYLPPEYIESLRAQYPPELIEAYLQGNFVNLASTNIFSSYNRTLCQSEVKGPEPNEVVHVGMDFNIGQCFSALAVIRQEGPRRVVHFFAEMSTRDTYETADQLRRKFPGWISARRLNAYPDHAGGSAHTSSTTTDHGILRSEGINVLTQNKNPDLFESFCHTNALFHAGEIKVNTATCPQLAAALERYAYNEDGKPIKGGTLDYSHATDALRYLIWAVKNGSGRRMGRGRRVY
jgi:hypothetical protein